MHTYEQISDTEIIFTLRTRIGVQNLMISTHSVYNRIHFTSRQYTTLETPGNFVMLLRKLLMGMCNHMHDVLKNFTCMYTVLYLCGKQRWESMVLFCQRLVKISIKLHKRIFFLMWCWQRIDRTRMNRTLVYAVSCFAFDAPLCNLLL